MLSLLHIENIAVIECADISFDRGFNVLTGETGAGKSIVIDAISAILGQRAYRDMIRTGTNKASVRAVFTDVPRLSVILKFHTDHIIEAAVFQPKQLRFQIAPLDGRHIPHVQPDGFSAVNREVGVPAGIMDQLHRNGALVRCHDAAAHHIMGAYGGDQNIPSLRLHNGTAG